MTYHITIASMSWGFSTEAATNMRTYGSTEPTHRSYCNLRLWGISILSILHTRAVGQKSKRSTLNALTCLKLT